MVDMLLYESQTYESQTVEHAEKEEFEIINGS